MGETCAHRKGTVWKGKHQDGTRPAAAIVTTTAGLLALSGLAAGNAGAAGLRRLRRPAASPLDDRLDGAGKRRRQPLRCGGRPAQHAGDEFRGNILISNFNNSGNVQGTGTTITEVTPSGKTWVFAKINRHLAGCPGGVGLTTALVALRSGWVIVGSLPTRGGNVSGAGCLIVVDPSGHVRETFTGKHQRSVGHDRR